MYPLAAPATCNDTWLYILVVELLVLVVVHYNHGKVNILLVRDLAYTHNYFLKVIWEIYIAWSIEGLSHMCGLVKKKQWGDKGS